MLEFQVQPKHGSVEFEFVVGFGHMLGHLETLLGFLGCWRLLVLEFQVQPMHGLAEVEFVIGFEHMLGHWEAMLGLNWVHLGTLGLSWAILGSGLSWAILGSVGSL